MEQPTISKEDGLKAIEIVWLLATTGRISESDAERTINAIRNAKESS